MYRAARLIIANAKKLLEKKAAELRRSAEEMLNQESDHRSVTNVEM
jgi:hypothetical protein